MVARRAADACAPSAPARDAAAARQAVDRRSAVRQHERRPGAGVFRRRHHRGHHHRPVASSPACSSSPATRPSPTRARPSTSGRSAASSACAIVLEGSVRRAGGRVRINAQLIDGTTGGHLWAERYDRDLERHLRGPGRGDPAHRRRAQGDADAGEEARRGTPRQGRSGSLRPAGPGAPDDAAAPPRSGGGCARDARAAIEIDPRLGRRLCPASGYRLRWICQPMERGDGATTSPAPWRLPERRVDIDENEPQGYISLALALRWMRRPRWGERARRARHRARSELGNRSHRARQRARIPRPAGRRGRASTRAPIGSTRNSTWRCTSSVGRCSPSAASTRRRRRSRRRLGLAPRSDMSRFYLACVMAAPPLRGGAPDLGRADGGQSGLFGRAPQARAALPGSSALDPVRASATLE